MLDVRGLTKKYRNRAVVDHVTFPVPAGRGDRIPGPNGSGKSTTVKMLAGLLSPTSGQIFWNGADIRHDLIGFKRDPGLRAGRGLRLSAPYRAGASGADRPPAPAARERKWSARPTELLRLLWLHELRYSPISSYSKGMKQRVLIAGALLHDPDLLILDEPLCGLDIASAHAAARADRRTVASGKTILYISHVLEVTEKVCSRVVMLYQGKIVANDEVGRSARPDEPPSLEQIFRQLAARRMSERRRAADRCRHAGGLMKSAFTLLVRHFFGRFFDNEIVSQQRRHAHQRGAGASDCSPRPACSSASTCFRRRSASTVRSSTTGC